MEQNHRVIFQNLIEAEHARRGGATEISDFFEEFSAEQILKSYEMSYDEIKDGIVDGTHDGGIDSIYLFVDSNLAEEGVDYSDRTQRVNLRLVIIQSKYTTGFGEDPIHRMRASLANLFNLNVELHEFAHLYNADVIAIMERFRTVHQQVIHTIPDLSIDIYAAGRGDEPSTEIRTLAEQLRSTVANSFPGSTATFNFLGAVRLLAIARENPTNNLQLVAADGPLSTDDGGLIFLVKIGDLYEMIRDDNGNMRKSLFESNVRDYQGRNEVNDDIKNTLEHGQQDEDFWWLNNGITILCTDVGQQGRRVALERPQIVNGMQTSTEIFNYFVRNSQVVDDRKVLVRALKPVSGDSRDRIIKATNFQAKISDASLRATDTMQRDIEDHFLNNGLYYDRRRNYYKNEGRPRDLIVEVKYLAQAYMSIVLQRPDDARARPSSLLKDDLLYRRIFDQNNPVDSYVVAAKLMRRIEGFLKGPGAAAAAGQRNNVRFHVAMHVASMSIGRAKIRPVMLVDFDVASISDQRLADSLTTVMNDLVTIQHDYQFDADRAAKSPEFADLVFQHCYNVPAQMSRL
jgi:hypothetical protein